MAKKEPKNDFKQILNVHVNIHARMLYALRLAEVNSQSNTINSQSNNNSAKMSLQISLILI